MTSMTELLRTDRLLDDLADRRAALSGSDPLARALLALAEDVDGPPEQSRATRAPHRTAARRPAVPVAGTRRPRGRSRWLGGGALAAALVAGSSFAAAVTEVDRPGWGAAETPGTRSVAAHGQPSPASLTTAGSWPLLPPVPEAVTPPPSSGSMGSPAELGLLLGLDERPGQALDLSAAPAGGTPDAPAQDGLAPSATGDGQRSPAAGNGPTGAPPGPPAPGAGSPAAPAVPATPATPARPGGAGAPGVPTDQAPPGQARPDAGAMARPATPADPRGPGEPATPADPGGPGEPATPAIPAVPADPGTPATPADPAPGGPDGGGDQAPPEQAGTTGPPEQAGTTGPPEQAAAPGTSAEPATPDRPGLPPAPPGPPADPPGEASDGDLP